MIADVVRAAAAVADEIVVVDSGSTDDTRQLAVAAGARVIDQVWLGNGRQKRVGEDACRHDWLLDLDADEIISIELAAEIRAMFADGPPPRPVYRTPVAIAPPVGETWVGFGGVVRHKLYDRRVVRAPDDTVWDQFDIPADVAPGVLHAPILHYAFANTEHLIAKLNKNSSTRAEKLALKPAPVLALRIFFGLPFYFSKRYFLHGLFRGGVYGFSFAMMSAFGRWMRDVKMFERWKRERRGDV